MASPSASSSSGGASVPGTSPCFELCRIVRLVLTPHAPGPQRLLGELRHLGDLVGVGLALVGALAHHVGAQGGVRHLGGDVDGTRRLVERVEVLGEALPVPVDALVQRGAGDVLHALHQLDQEVLGAGAHRREADAAVAHDDGGDAVPARRGDAPGPR